MKITNQRIVNEDFEIPVPSFWKADIVVTEPGGKPISQSWYGLLDEKTLVCLYESLSMKSVMNQEPYDGRVGQIHRDNLPATEAEFFEAFERVYKSLSLKPELVRTIDPETEY